MRSKSAGVAARLHVGVRTLRRRLREEGTSFRAIVEQSREHRAEELLVTAGLSIEQVARRLGYAKPSTFVHAFRRWKLVRPGRWAMARQGGRTGAARGLDAGDGTPPRAANLSG